MNWFFHVVFLVATCNAVLMEPIRFSPKLKVIESVFKRSLEKTSHTKPFVNGTIPVPIPVEDVSLNGTIPIPIPVGDVSRIIGGQTTTIKDFPWQVWIGNCGGSIISKNWIMSAAHCFARGINNKFDDEFEIYVTRIDVFAGLTERSLRYSDPDVQHRIIYEDEIQDHLFVHHDYKKGAIFNNDIALVKLKDPLTFNEKVQPIDLADISDYVPGKELITSGWGKTADDGGTSDILRYVDGLNLITKEECKEAYGIYVTDKNICHKTENKNICNGDSGGPVICGIGSNNGPPYVQIGINSFVSGLGCEADRPAGLTDVSQFRSWIDEVISVPCSSLGGKNVAGQCLIISEESKSWTQAVQSCQANGQRLAVLQNPVAFHSYLQTNYAGGRFWLGASDIKDEGTWTWNSGHSLDGFPWPYGEPNDYGNGEDCLSWGHANNYNDASCTDAYRYVCEPAHSMEYACEHGGTDLNIRCPVGHAINVSSANYGRTSNDICNDEGIQWHNDNCRSETSLQVVTDRCSGQRSCNIAPSNTIFGDPCGGVFKYLEVHYDCEQPVQCSESEGFFKWRTTNQCFKFIHTGLGVSWDAANARCREEGLELAKTIDPVPLRKFLLETYGDGKYMWIGGRGTGSSVEWIRDGSTISRSNPAWYPEDHHDQTSASNCLKLLTYQSDLERYPDHPYYLQPCDWTPNLFPLCELVITPECKAPWFRVGSQCFYWAGHPSNQYNWYTARSFCQDLYPGGDLAQPRDIQALAVYLFPIHHTFYWLGGSDSRTEGDWRWLDGTTVTGGWRAGQPENANGDEDCLTIHPVYQSANSLFAQPCDRTEAMLLLCERP